MRKKPEKNKLRWSLLPWTAVQQLAEVLNHSASKYDDHSWTEVDNPNEVYFNALMRHLIAWRNGEQYDKESGKTHLAHAGCCLLFLIWFETPDELFDATRSIKVSKGKSLT